MGILVEPLQGGGRVHVPEDHHLAGAPQVQHGTFHERVAHTDPAGLHQQVRLGRRLQAGHGPDLAHVHHHLGPIRLVDVPMLLSAVGVRLVEDRAVPERVQGADDAAVVGRGPVPMGRQQTGSKERDVKSHGHGPR